MINIIIIVVVANLDEMKNKHHTHTIERTYLRPHVTKIANTNSNRGPISSLFMIVKSLLKY